MILIRVGDVGHGPVLPSGLRHLIIGRDLPVEVHIARHGLILALACAACIDVATVGDFAFPLALEVAVLRTEVAHLVVAGEAHSD